MQPKFIQTENVKKFTGMMLQIEDRIGTDSLGMVHGRAGRGKTETARWYAAQNGCPYVESLRDWTVLWLYQDVLAAFGVPRNNLPSRKKQAFDMIIDRSAELKKPIILDEADLIGPRLLETVRDLCKMTKVPWVLIGEESLPSLMNKDRRVWSRRCASLEFQPMSAADIIVFSREAAGLAIKGEPAALIQRATGGDIRLIELVLSTAETIARANSASDIDCDTAQAAVSQVIPDSQR